MTDLKILAWDIENTPLTTYSWTLWPNHIPIQNIIKPQEIMSFSARWVGESARKTVFYSTFHDGKETMLKRLWELLDEADALLSWNGAGFDTKHANREFIENGLTPPSPATEIDLMRVAKRKFKFPSNKLDYVAQALGVGHKTKHEGFQLWLDCMANDPKAWATMKKYNMQDVDLLIDLYEKFKPWIPASLHPNSALVDGKVFACPRCSSTDLESRGFYRTQAGTFRRYRCNGCGHWPRDSRRVDAVDDGVEPTTRLRST